MQPTTSTGLNVIKVSSPRFKYRSLLSSVVIKTAVCNAINTPLTVKIVRFHAILLKTLTLTSYRPVCRFISNSSRSGRRLDRLLAAAAAAAAEPTNDRRQPAARLDQYTGL